MATSHPDRPSVERLHPDRGSVKERWIGGLLVVYLFVIGIGACLLLVTDFPQVTLDESRFPFPRTGFILDYASLSQALLLMAFLGGIVGSFLHAAQSLITYLGNRSFVASWTAWYMIRPWIGGVLGVTLYFAFRAGLVTGTGDFNPYGVIALALLGGWFSKTATDKLQEVFETLFRTDADRKRRDKLNDNDEPILDG